MPKNILSAVPVPGGFAVAIDGKPTAQVFPTQQLCLTAVDEIKSERKEMRELLAKHRPTIREYMKQNPRQFKSAALADFAFTHKPAFRQTIINLYNDVN